MSPIESSLFHAIKGASVWETQILNKDNHAMSPGDRESKASGLVRSKSLEAWDKPKDPILETESYDPRRGLEPA